MKVYKIADGMYGGISYYWRGAVTNNYIIFADKCWRIIRINGDGTIRLIYDGSVCHANGANSDSIALRAAYNSSSGAPAYVGYTYDRYQQRTLEGTPSNLKTQTDAWYESSIGYNENYEKYVADGYFCNDREARGNWSPELYKTLYYTASNRFSMYNPTLSCPVGDKYTLKVGAITADEVYMAGSNPSSGGYTNKTYFLYNGQSYWTMTPYAWYYEDSALNSAQVYTVDTLGMFSKSSVAWNNCGIRPVINLRADTQFSGVGLENDPFIVI